MPHSATTPSAIYGSFQLIPADHKRPDQVEEHAGQVRKQAEDRDDKMFEPVESMVFLKGHHRYPAGDHIEQKCAEIADQRHNDQRVWQRSIGLRRKYSEAVPDVVLVKRCRRCASQIDRHSDDAQDHGYHCQGPDRAMGRGSFPVQHSKVGRHFFVAAHGIRNTRAGAET